MVRFHDMGADRLCRPPDPSLASRRTWPRRAYVAERFPQDRRCDRKYRSKKRSAGCAFLPHTSLGPATSAFLRATFTVSSTVLACRAHQRSLGRARWLAGIKRHVLSLSPPTPTLAFRPCVLRERGVHRPPPVLATSPSPAPTPSCTLAAPLVTQGARWSPPNTRYVRCVRFVDAQADDIL